MVYDLVDKLMDGECWTNNNSSSSSSSAAAASVFNSIHWLGQKNY